MDTRRNCVCCGRWADFDAQYTIAPNIPKPRCPRCFFRRLAHRHLKQVGQWKDVRALFLKQNGCCLYTGEPLTLGGNASLDHRQPKSRGGKDRIENLQWVTVEVNELKRNLTHDEFVAICRKVANASHNTGTTDHERSSS